MTRTHLGVIAVLLLSSPFASGTVSAQELRWRIDYAAARKEATDTGRPLLLDFGTEACSWCKKLDATTFRDPKVVNRIIEQFIPVKIDARKYERLASSLKVEGFPTLILAMLDGKVIGRHEGYADVAQLTTLLNKAPAPRAPNTLATTGTDPQKSPSLAGADLEALFPEIVASLDR